ncbi:TetR/AcrR family transcriptional regulator [Nocardioides humilatus]|uniref:TetR/AcrR family transcriptional regulator n=1 Tax=Nocardioides humilatus TaxID=2607660 RepID=A0A5B1LQ63_9ACTN|nr:TetR/AcrR family transcriptional regulator [Nocardioides humilatus]KAA1421829.1 TetR/AcrR family transcriptional regulator [Nocardioides humilatus]
MPHVDKRTPRTRAAHLGPERRRPSVLDAARAIAVDQGIGAVTIGAVAKEMGVTRPVVYSCFSDRVEMVEALLERESSALLWSVISALRSSGVAEDPEKAFVDGFRALLVGAAEHPEAWMLLLSGEPDPALSARFREARAHVREQSTAWIGPAMERWWQTPDLERKLPVLIELFMSSCESAVRSLLDDDNDWAPDDLGELVGKAVHRALRDA